MRKKRKLGKGKVINLNQIPIRKGFSWRSKSCPFSGKDAPQIDYKDIKLLGRYVSEHGKIIPSRISNVSLKNQRLLATAIKRARFLALMPYISDEKARLPRSNMAKSNMAKSDMDGGENYHHSRAMDSSASASANVGAGAGANVGAGERERFKS